MPLSLIHWVGGKGRQLNDLLPLIPSSRIYVEVFGGGGAVLLNKQRSEIEVYNDLDGQLVNLFRVIRDPESYNRFKRLVAYTPYSRAIFERSLDGMRGDEESIESAVDFYTTLNQSISGKRLATTGDWARNRTSNVADAWFTRQEGLINIHERIKTVQLECRDGLNIIKQWDTPETTFYLDPPYILDTRGGNKYYAVEPGDDYHIKLVDTLLKVNGMAVLSGYDHPIYDRLQKEGGWAVHTYGEATTMDLAESKQGRTRSRVEVVYRNPRAASFSVQPPLPFEAGPL